MDNQPPPPPPPSQPPVSMESQNVENAAPSPDQKQPNAKETALGCGCLSVIVLAVALFLKGCFFSGESPKGSTTGISYSQMMGHGLGELFDVKQSSDVDGRKRYMGESKSGTAMLELIGEKDDLYQATLIMGKPGKDATSTLHAGFTLAFLGNVDGTWTGPERAGWFGEVAKEFAGKEHGKASITRGKNRITIELMDPLGLTITVEAAK